MDKQPSNDEKISSWLADISNDAFSRTGVNIADLLEFSLGRVVANNMKKPVRLPLEDISKDSIRHICDWLTASRLRNEDWLTNCDNKGRPLKLMKFGSIDQILVEANKAMVKWNNQKPSGNEGGSTKVVHHAGDGFTIVELLDTQALEHEGKVMGHCIGQGSYDFACASNYIGLYSLRDRFGKSHITIEIDNIKDHVDQIKGKQNKLPKPEYVRRLIGWNKLCGLEIYSDELPYGFGMDKQKGIVEFSSLKPGDTFENSLTVSIITGDEFKNLIPAGVTINGDVSLMGCVPLPCLANIVIPDDLKVEGELYLNNLEISLDKITAETFMIRNSIVKKLGVNSCADTHIVASELYNDALDNAVFEGNLYIQACRFPNFTAKTSIAGNLYVGGCGGKQTSPDPWEPVATFSDEFTLMKGHLQVTDSDVEFGAALRARHGIEIRRCRVDRMPVEVQTSGNALFDKVEIDQWPSIMKVGGSVTQTDATIRGETSLGM